MRLIALPFAAILGGCAGLPAGIDPSSLERTRGLDDDVITLDAHPHRQDKRRQHREDD